MCHSTLKHIFHIVPHQRTAVKVTKLDASGDGVGGRVGDERDHLVAVVRRGSAARDGGVVHEGHGELGELLLVAGERVGAVDGGGRLVALHLVLLGSRDVVRVRVGEASDDDVRVSEASLGENSVHGGARAAAGH